MSVKYSEITKTRLYFPGVTLPTQDNAKFLQQFKAGFKGLVHWNKYTLHVEKKSKPISENFIDPNFQSFNNLFDLAFGDDDDIKLRGHASCYLSKE